MSRTTKVMVDVAADVYNVLWRNLNVAYVKKVLAKSQPIFKLKSPKLFYQDWFLCRGDAVLHTTTSV